MSLERSLKFLAILLSCFAALSLARGATNVLMWHNDRARTGQNLRETQLTPANVNASNFGKLFQINVDGNVYAQPLIVSNVTIPNKGVHNVVIIATENDTVYCRDADNGTALWRKSVLKAGETPSDPRNCSQITPEIGITATPVIDLATGPHGTIYVVAMSKSGTSYFQRLHALDLTTGAEQFGGPVDIVASYPGTGANNNGQGFVVFDPKQYKERVGLVLNNGIVYTFWASHCDINPFTGWVIGYNKNTLARVRVLNLTPNGSDGAIWASGAGPAVDASGNIYALVANGTFDTSLNPNRFPSKGDFGNCIVKLSNANSALAVTDYWTMYNTLAESSADQDLGSGGAMLLPDMIDINGVTRHLLVGAGKDAHIYIANRDNLGKFVASSNATLYQEVSGALAHGVFGAPAYFNGHLYYGAVNDQLKSFIFSNARLEPTPSSKSAVTFGYPGTIPSVSANGTLNAIVWAARNGTLAELHAFHANNLATQLYASTDAGSRDSFGSGNKFVVPTIANGKVYVGTTSSVGVFGLFNPPHLSSISVRAKVGVAENVLVAGFAIQGSESTPVVLRAIGPSLAANERVVEDRLSDPVLELRDDNDRLISFNDDWQTNNADAAQIRQANLAPPDSKESAIYATLPSGNYKAILSGANNATGIAVLEIYDLSTRPGSNLANLSARALVGPGDDVLIGGVTVSGAAPETVLFRAMGPDLANDGIADALPDPVLDVRDSDGMRVALNTHWRDAQSVEISATGLAPASDNAAALLLTLSPGTYTALVSGASGGSGVALLEVYDVR